MTGRETSTPGTQAECDLAAPTSGKMRVALDIDDTITRHPIFFSFLSNALVDSGHEVYIISYREGQEDVETDLAADGISFTEVVLPTPDDLDRDGFYGWKAATCRRLGVEVFFEDMPEVVNELDTDVLAFVPYDADLGGLRYVDQPET